MKGIIRLSAALGAIVVVASAGPAWSQAQVPQPAGAEASTAPATQPQRSDERGDGRGDGRGLLRGDGGERRFDGRFGDGMRPPRMEWRRGDYRLENLPEPSEDEWRDTVKFMKEHSPERLQRLEEIGDEQRQQVVKKIFADRYRAMQELKEQNPELHKIRLARMPIEDKAFDLAWRLMRKQSDKPEETRSQLRAQLRLLIKNRLEERALHLRNMQNWLKADQERIDELVEANLSDISDGNLPRDLRPHIPQRRASRGDDEAPNVPASPTGEQ